jgi:hypothetical protein
MVEAGELNRPRDPQPATGEVLDSPTKSKSFGDYPENERGSKMAEKDPNNPEKPDPVQSTKPRRR